MKMKAVLVGLTMGMLATTAVVAEEFATLKGIQAQPMSEQQMEQIQGKGLFDKLKIWGAAGSVKIHHSPFGSSLHASSPCCYIKISHFNGFLMSDGLIE